MATVINVSRKDQKMGLHLKPKFYCKDVSFRWSRYGENAALFGSSSLVAFACRGSWGSCTSSSTKQSDHHHHVDFYSSYNHNDRGHKNDDNDQYVHDDDQVDSELQPWSGPVPSPLCHDNENDDDDDDDDDDYQYHHY